MYLNCLLHVSGERPLELTEWLDFHLALGFDCVYVYDSGNRPWIDGICERYGEKVRLMPRIEGGWTKRRDIVADHLSKRKSPEWCICLMDNEYVWIDFRQVRSLKDYIQIAGMRTRSRAITGYFVYMGAKNPMPNRVGSVIDCFTHTRPNPQGKVAPNGKTLFGGETFFLYDRMGMQPLAGPIQPTCAEWVDGNGARLTKQALDAANANGFNSLNYAMRIYKYAVLSDKEMNYAVGEERPGGYTQLDLSMQNLRKFLLGAPVVEESETLFTKPADFDEAADAVKNGPARTDTLFDVNLPGLPITRAKLDQLILEGNYYEDVVEYLNARGIEFNQEILLSAFDKERQTIVDSSPVYRQVQELIDDGRSVKEISKITGIAEVTLDRMSAALKVLDIRTGVITEDVIAKAVGAFEEAEEKAMSAKEIEQNDARFAEVNAKRAAAQKKSRENRALKKAGKQVQKKTAEDDLPMDILSNGEQGALDKALDALGSDDDMPSAEAIAEIEEKHEEKAPVTIVIEPVAPATPAPAPEAPAAPAPKKGKK